MDKELKKIVEKAIPLSGCNIQKQYELHWREKLKCRIKEYIAKQLEEFNAKEVV